jgi:hypothetical protein
LSASIALISSDVTPGISLYELYRGGSSSMICPLHPKNRVRISMTKEITRIISLNIGKKKVTVTFFTDAL